MIRNKIPVSFFFLGMTRNKISLYFLFRETGGIPTKHWSVSSCSVFREKKILLEIGNPTYTKILEGQCREMFLFLANLSLFRTVFKDL